MVLVDTSVWIDFFRKSRTAEAKALATLIASEQDIATCGVIRQEILQGIRDDLMLRRVRALLDQMHYLPLEEPRTFDEAADIFRQARLAGKTLRRPLDCIIAAIAMRWNVQLLQRDHDFTTIAIVAPLLKLLDIDQKT
ncbi:MAG: PIN domain nuclease [Deltaproteobacteria bacterium]|nr:PIN domain nuclease [Deltaproteobacteria bacterium]